MINLQNKWLPNFDRFLSFRGLKATFYSQTNNNNDLRHDFSWIIFGEGLALFLEKQNQAINPSPYLNL